MKSIIISIIMFCFYPCYSSVIHYEINNKDDNQNILYIKKYVYGGNFETLDSIFVNRDTTINIGNSKVEIIYLFLNNMIKTSFLLSPNDSVHLLYDQEEFIVDNAHASQLKFSNQLDNYINHYTNPCEYEDYFKNLDSSLRVINQEINKKIEDIEIQKFFKEYYLYSISIIKADYILFNYLEGECTTKANTSKIIKDLKKISSKNSDLAFPAYSHFIEKLCMLYYYNNQDYYKADKERMLETIKNEFNGVSFEISINWWINSHLEKVKSEEDLNQLLNVFKSIESRFEYHSILTSIHNLFKKRKLILPGKPILNFDILTIHGDTLSLQDYKNKIVYMNFWSTGCTYCIQEHEAYNNIYRKYKNDSNMVFINIAFEPKEKLVNYFEKNELPGYNCFTEAGFMGKIANDYMIAGIPQYLILNRGHYYDINAPRPSNEALIKILDGLLNME